MAIYDPEDPLEQAIQGCYHKSTSSWLPAGPCRLMARALRALKVFDDWFDEPHLFNDRIAYFFDPQLILSKSILVFVTNTIFLRDISENHIISGSLHDPIVFMSRPLAHYLFQEYDVHIHVHESSLRSANPGRFVEIGGLSIADDCDIQLPPDAIDRIVRINIPRHEKTAVSQISEGVFGIDGDDRMIGPGDEMFNKSTGTICTVNESMAGENGPVTVECDGEQTTIPKTEVDLQFSPMRIAESQQKYPVVIDGRRMELPSQSIAQLIKKRLLSLQCIQKLFKRFKIDPSQLDKLEIQILDMEGKYGETDLHTMKLNSFLFTKGDFFRDYFFVPVHELIHWFFRFHEQHYFNDEEEVDGFVMSIAYEMESGSSLEEIFDKLYGKVSFHFHDKADAKEFFDALILKAKKFLLTNTMG